MRPGPLVLPALAVLAVSAPAQAGRDGPDIVQVVIAATQFSDATALRDDLFELFGRIDATAWYRDARAIDPDQLMKPTPGAPAALAHVWIDLGVSKPDRVLVYLADAGRNRVLLRTVHLTRGLDEVAREEVSLIVASAVDTLRSGAPLAAGHVGDVLLSPPPAPPDDRIGVWLNLGASGAAERWSADQAMVPLVGLSAVVGRGAARRFQPALWLTAGYHGATTSSDPIDLQLRGVSLALLALPGWRLSPRVALRAGVGPGLDLMSVTPLRRAGTATVEVDGPRWVTTAFARAAVRADLDLTRSLLAFLAAGTDVQIVKSRFVVERGGGGQDAVYEPARFRPSVLVGIEGRIMGAGLR